MSDDAEDRKLAHQSDVVSAMGTPVCSHCDTPIETTEWFPIVTETTESESVVLHSFCDETCQDEWEQS